MDERESLTFPVEAVHVLAFARAVGDPNPVYRDAAYATRTEVGGVIAPPTFVTAAHHVDPHTPLRPAVGEAWHGSGREPSGRDGDPESVGWLHAEQHFEYVRTVRAGEVLSVDTRQGRRWDKQGRSGTLHFVERLSDYRDATGAVVVRARAVAVRPEPAASAH